MMRKWFLGLGVRIKLFFAFGSILIMSILLLLVGIYTIRKVIDYNNLSEDIDRINVATLLMAAEIQEFSDRGYKDELFHTSDSSSNLYQHGYQFTKVNETLARLTRTEYFQNARQAEKLSLLSKNLDNYKSDVLKLVDKYSERGFQDYGKEGELRSAIHSVEDSDYSYDKVSMLTLRRHEKDFFLRKNLKYLQRFKKEVENFQQSVLIDSLSQNRSSILNSIISYENLFEEIVNIEQEIGLDEFSGIRGKVLASLNTIQSSLATLTATVKKDKEEVVQTAFILFSVLIATQLILGGVLIIFYAGLLSNAIKEIKSALVDISEGRFPEALMIKTKDEIAEAKLALNDLVQRVKIAVSFANELGQGNLEGTYDSRYNHDVLAKSIIQMQQKLNEADRKQKDINWLNEGLAQFSELMKNDNDNLETLADLMISSLVKYLNANQGAIFITKEDKLDAIATYAYGKKKFIYNAIPIGQGLVGQCAIEKEFIHLKDVPQDYVKITSGLGEATPTNLILMPLKHNEEVMGVIEMASFNNFTSLHLEYLSKVGESIASILSSKKVADQTIKLLDEAREKTATLSAQEEELRQNAEELQATQEEMVRQKDELEQTIIHLKKELALKEEFIAKRNLEASMNQN